MLSIITLVFFVVSFFIFYRFDKRFNIKSNKYAKIQSSITTNKIIQEFKDTYGVLINIKENTEIDVFIPSEEKVYLSKTELKENLYHISVLLHEGNHVIQYKEKYFPLQLFLKSSPYRQIMLIILMILFLTSFKLPVVLPYFFVLYIMFITFYAFSVIRYEYNCYKRTNKLINELYNNKKIKKDEASIMKEIQKDALLLYVLYTPIGFLR